MIRFLFCAFLAFSLPLSAMAQAGGPAVISPRVEDAPKPPPVVLELFTSQGCAFCPPADELMGQMSQQQGIIALSCHVDYFNVRKNSLGKSFCTKRQNDYNRILATGPRYTPQLVINGHMDMIGYETGKVSAGILKARSEKMAEIQLTPIANGSFSFSLPQSKQQNGPVQLWMAIFQEPQSLAMTEGANFGKKITYYNVVNRMDALGEWNGAAETRTFNAVYLPTDAGIAVLAQNMQTGRIIAAGAIYR